MSAFLLSFSGVSKVSSDSLSGAIIEPYVKRAPDRVQNRRLAQISDLPVNINVFAFISADG
jgi:hypothetical protein